MGPYVLFFEWQCENYSIESTDKNGQAKVKFLNSLCGISVDPSGGRLLLKYSL